MTPKEKAEELVEMFMNIRKQKLADYSIIYHPTAKQCALIAIKEMLKITYPFCDRHEEYYLEAKDEMKSEYWNQVEQEIETL